MGSSSVRRAMSNRSNPEHVQSFTTLRKLETANTSLDNSEVNGSVLDLGVGCGDNQSRRSASSSQRFSFRRSKSVASGLPIIRDVSQDSSFHNGSYATKSLLRRKTGESRRGRSISRFFNKMKNIVVKDKNRRIKSSDDESSSNYSTLPSHSTISYVQDQSQSCLTPSKLKQVQHHSTPRLMKPE